MQKNLQNFNLYDIVVLKESIDEITKGSLGTIVYIYSEELVEVEFENITKTIQTCQLSNKEIN